MEPDVDRTSQSFQEMSSQTLLEGQAKGEFLSFSISTSARNTMQSFQEISSQPLRERQGQEDVFMLIEHHMYNKCSKHNAIILVITSPPLRERQGQDVFVHADRTAHVQQLLETQRIHSFQERYGARRWSNISIISRDFEPDVVRRPGQGWIFVILNLNKC